MNLDITHADLWTAEIDDQPGGLARTLKGLSDYGADLDYVFARRYPHRPGKGVMFVSPIQTREALENASQVGLHRAMDVAALRIEGPNEAGVGATLTKVIADAGVNLNSLSGNVVGHRFVCYAGFDSLEDREKAETALKALTKHDWHFWRRHHEEAAATIEHR